MFAVTGNLVYRFSIPRKECADLTRLVHARSTRSILSIECIRRVGKDAMNRRSSIADTDTTQWDLRAASGDCPLREIMCATSEPVVRATSRVLDVATQPLESSASLHQPSHTMRFPSRVGLCSFMMRPCALAAVWLTLAAPALRSQQAEPYPGLDAYVTRAMATWKVPGVAIGIVRNDSVIYTKGYGVRSIKSNAPVDARTLFAIGSNSKSFTAAAIAMLVTDGKMDYDAPVTRYLPWFQLFDPWVTREVTIRDVLAHRIGLGRQEALWYGTSLSRDEVLRHVRFLEPSFSFRAHFGYSNLMYLAAGQAAAAAAGTSWDTLIHDRIFVPLGMTGSNTSVRALAGQANVATPHLLAHDSLFTLPYRNLDNVGPAGAINSNVADMTQWLRFQLADGVYDGKRLVGKEPFRQGHLPQTIIGGGWNPDAKEQLTLSIAYGFGWAVADYRRHTYWQHTGGIDGMLSSMALLPEQHFGVIILTNSQSANLTTPLAQWIADRELGITPARDWNEEMHRAAMLQESIADSMRRAAAAKRELHTTPSLPLAAYAGTYGDSAYGDLAVTLNNGHLALQRGELAAQLTHWHHDVFQTESTTRMMDPIFVAFTVGPDNTVETLTMDILGDHMVLHRKAPVDH
jgi:CubicO group peptidase (beta-lactamase class C family)